MAHKFEHISTGAGFKVLNDGTESIVIAQSGEEINLVVGSGDPTSIGGITFKTGIGYRLLDDTGLFTIPRSGGGPGSDTLDSAYENGSSVGLDQGATTWTDSTTGSLNSFELVKDGAGSGNLLDLSIDAALTGAAIAIDMNLGIAAEAIFIDNGATARTGADILITDNSTGNHSCIDINSSGNSASIGFDWTGSFSGSPGGSAISLTSDNSDNLDTESILITRGTGARTASAISIVDTSTGSDDLINIDIGGVFTGDVIDITTSAAATGNAIFLNLDSAVAMTALHIEGSGVRTQPYIELITDSTSSASLIDISVDGAITGQAALDIDMNAGLAANAIYIDAGGNTRTANLLEFKDDGDGNVDTIAIVAANTGSGSVLDIDVTGIRTGNIIDIAMSGAATSTAVIAIDLNLAVAAAALFLDAGSKSRTADIIDCTFDGSGNISFIDLNCTNTGSGNLFDIAITGVHTGNAINIGYPSAASTGNAIDIAMGTNISGNAIAILTAGIRTSPVFFIDGAGTDAGTDDHIFDINQSGKLDSNVIDITYSSSASTGDAIALNMGTNVAGSAIDIDSAGTGDGCILNVAHTGNLANGSGALKVVSTGDFAAADGNLVELEQNTGAGTAGNNVLKLTASGTNVEALEVAAGKVYWATQDVVFTGNDETITSIANVVFADPDGGSRTGVIVAAGLRDGEHIKIVNIADASENLTFATAGTSNVSVGTTLVIGQNEAVELVWNTATSLWYPLATVFS